MRHTIARVLDHSIAKELQIEAGDVLLSINKTPISDIFDYQFLVQDEFLTVLIEKPSGEKWELEIEKDEDDDLGIEFENAFMDDYKSCHNKCIFCFIDQMPKGMRKSLYFKDDDSRLSFLRGNYVTLTNMSDEDVERIIRYHLSPINVSFQTMNPELRCKMLNNRFAGEALKKVQRFADAGIVMNGQIVLCKGINDGAELDRSISEILKLMPNVESVSVVPVGLSKFRDGLYPLEPFTKEDACRVIDQIEHWQQKIYPQYGLHLIHASDEWYILAGRDLPQEERYDGYLQLENGVGMLRLLLDEFADGLRELKRSNPAGITRAKTVSLATARLAFPYIREMAQRLMEAVDGLTIHVYEIRNDFFGEMITVSGLLTGQDIIAQLQGRELGETLLLPENVLRADGDLFLDDLTLSDMENALHCPVDIVKSSGTDFIETILR